MRFLQNQCCFCGIRRLSEVIASAMPQKDHLNIMSLRKGSNLFEVYIIMRVLPIRLCSGVMRFLFDSN